MSYNEQFYVENQQFMDTVNEEIPLPSKQRKVTDLPFILALLLSILIVACLGIYVRITADTTDILQLFSIKIEDNEEGDLSSNLGIAFIVFGIGFALTLIVLALYRFIPGLVVWTVLTATILVLLLLTLALWIAGKLIGTAITFTIITIIVIALCIALFKRIRLLIRLMKETSKMIFGVPLILLQPIPTFIMFLIMYATAIWVFTAYYSSFNIPTGVGRFTIGMSIVMCVWLSFFFSGCQNMVIAGCASKYYFTRNKSELSMFGTLVASNYNLIRYHLGTVALGSFFSTLFYYFRRLWEMLYRQCCCCCCGCCVSCCCAKLENLFKFLSNNVYIVTAIYGQPFFKSGKHAIKLLTENSVSVIAISFVGNYVIFMSTLLIVVSSFGIGYAIDDKHIPGLVGGVIMTWMLASSFFNVFDITMDTLFLCFCEDQLRNNGTDKPYYMSKELMQFMEESKRMYSKSNKL